MTWRVLAAWAAATIGLWAIAETWIRLLDWGDAWRARRRLTRARRVAAQSPPMGWRLTEEEREARGCEGEGS